MNNKILLFSILFLFCLVIQPAFASQFIDNSQSLFNLGNYTNTTYNTTYNAILLSGTNLTGNYLSKIYDSSQMSSWNSISWLQEVCYLCEMPSNQSSDSGQLISPINMTGNILYFKLNEASGNIADYSGNGHDGTTANSPTYNVAGKFNGAMQFDSTAPAERVDTTNSLNYNVSGTGFTATAWIYVNGAVTPEIAGDIIGHYYPTSNNRSWVLQIQNNVTRLIGSADGTATTIATGTVPIGNTTGWYFVSGRWNTTHLNVFVNGVQTGNTPALASLKYNADQGIRLAVLGSAGGFDGKIDEVAVWNRSLSDTEILNMYKRGLDMNLSVRSCDDPSCSGESFSQLNDTSTQNMSLANNRYFQYKYNFSRDYSTYSPRLYNVTIDYNDYNAITKNSGNQTNWNETFTGNENKTFYIMLSKGAIIDDARLNLTGYITDINTQNFTSGLFTTASTRSNDPNGNYLGACSIGQSTGAGTYFRCHERLSLSSIDNTSIVNSSKIYGKISGSSGTGSFTVYMFNMSNDTWDASTLTWNNAPQPFGSSVSSWTTSNTINNWDTGTVSNLFVENENNRKDRIDFILKIDPESAINKYMDYDAISGNLILEVNWYKAPKNVYLINSDLTTDFSLSTELNNTRQINLNKTSIQTYLSSCTPDSYNRCLVPITIHSDTAGIINVNDIYVKYHIGNITGETYEPVVMEGTNSTYTLTVRHDGWVEQPLNTSYVNATLTINGTQYAPTKSIGFEGGYPRIWTFTYNYQVPDISGSQNVQFYWNYTLIDNTPYSPATDILFFGSTTAKTQTFTESALLDCGNLTNTTVLTINIKDEDTLTPLIAKISMNYRLWLNGIPPTSSTGNINKTGNSTYEFCLYPANESMLFNMNLEYWNDTYSYENRYYFIYNDPIGINNTINLTIYSQNDTTDITFFIYQQTLTPLSDAILQVRRYYTAEDTYKIVAMGRTGDRGETKLPLKYSSGIYYDYIVLRNGIVLKQFTPEVLDSTLKNLYVSTTEVADYFSYWNNVAYNCDISNATGIASCDVINTAGTPLPVTMNVYRYSNTSRDLICSDSETASSSATLTCNIGATNNRIFQQTLLLGSNGKNYLLSNKLVSFLPASILGKLGVLVSFFLILGCVIIGLKDPTLSLVMTIVGLVISYATGLLAVAPSVIVGIICILIFIIMKIVR